MRLLSLSCKGHTEKIGVARGLIVMLCPGLAQLLPAGPLWPHHLFELELAQFFHECG